MPQFLFVVEIPPTEGMSTTPGYSHKWLGFASDADTLLKPVKGTTRLALNVWLLAAEKALPVLAELSALASHHKCSYSSVLIPDGAVTLALDVKPKP
ncbi:MAG: hypothetical protein Q8L80_00685 [Gallionella sp.]|nr:hypothetical protein [Gallionella sp.]MDP1940059.1 hypothetical protein [Gallionella sp.]